MSQFGTWMRRGGDPLATAYLGRRLTVSSHLRLRDALPAWIAGRGDGKAGMLDAANLEQGGRVSTYWLQRNAASYEQTDRAEFLAMEATLAPAIRALDALVRERDELLGALDSQRAELEHLQQRAKPELATISRGVAEVNTDDAVVLARRQRLWDAPVTAAASRITSLETRIRAIAAEAAGLASIIQVGFGVAISRTDRARKYFERRAEVYRRALSRSSANGAVIQAAGIGTITIPAPDWTQQRCSWIPAEYLTTTTQKESADV